MSTEFCQQSKRSHPGRPCDYNDQGECTETVEVALAHPVDGDSAQLVSGLQMGNQAR